jgi:riboflavin-specific deaminase-like protein
MTGAMEFIRTLLSTAADHRRETGRPLVTLSYAQSLDGSISGRPGEALALSGRQSLVLTHKLRADHDAILVGIGTVFSDNPRLNVRLVNGSNPRPIVVDTRLRIPLDCKLLTQNPRGLWVITGENPDPAKREIIERSGARVMGMPCDGAGLVNLDAMLRKLGELGINSVMVEGGSRIITNFLLKRLANSMILTMAPVLLNGLRGVRDLGLETPYEGLHLRNQHHRKLGDDIILWGDLA